MFGEVWLRGIGIGSSSTSKKLADEEKKVGLIDTHSKQIREDMMC